MSPCAFMMLAFVGLLAIGLGGIALSAVFGSPDAERAGDTGRPAGDDGPDYAGETATAAPWTVRSVPSGGD